MFNQSLWGVFAHKDLVQTQPWHWLGGDLEGDLGSAVLGGCATKCCQVPEQAPKNLVQLPSSSLACSSCPLFIYTG